MPLPPVERAGGARLHWLRLSRNSLTCDAGVMLAEALGSPGGASLRHLDLSEVRTDSVSHQEDRLRSQRERNCRMLDLSENLLGHDAWGSPSNAALAAIARALPIRPRLASLSLARNDLTSAGVAEFARALPTSVGLSRLSLAGNVLGAPAARGIAAALVQARVGSSRDGAALDLTENMDPLSWVSRKLLAPPHARLNAPPPRARCVEDEHLTCLDLSDTQLDDAAVRALAGSLHTNNGQ